MDSVKLRLEREQALSFLEFNYMCLQAYDFVELTQAPRLHAADGRLGPVGQHRHRRRSRPPHGRRAQLFGLTTPLMTTASGAKMGKTAAGAVWLNADMLPRLRLLAISGATPRTPMSAASCGCSPTCRSTRSPGWPRCRRGDQRGEEDPGQRGHRAAARPRRGRGRRRDRAQDLRGRRAGRKPADRDVTEAEIGRRARRADRLRQGRPGRLDRRGAPPDQGRRRQAQRRRRSPTSAMCSRPRISPRTAWPNSRLGKKKHVLLKAR